MSSDGLYLGGYASHLWLDMVNVRGIDLFWPSPIRVVLPGRTACRLDVGGKAERVLLSGLVVLAVAMLPVSRMSVRGGLHRLLRNFDMAVEASSAPCRKSPPRLTDLILLPDA